MLKKNHVAVLKANLFVFAMLISTVVSAQKTQSFTVERTINLSAEKVWAVVGEDFGGIANSHPKIVSSKFNQGTLTAGEGAERVCYYNESGSKFVKEKQVGYDAENYTFSVQIFQAGKLPLVPELTQATYKVVPIDENSCRFEFAMEYRTKPAFMGAMAKGKFKKTIADYAIAVEHYAKTGEEVNKDNFKAIKKQYI